MPKKQSRARRRKKKPEIDLSDLRRAGEHFITGAAECIVGAGFAIKGARDLLNNEEGRKFLRDLPSEVADKGFELLNEASEHLKERGESKSKGSGRNRGRKIEVE